MPLLLIAGFCGFSRQDMARQSKKGLAVKSPVTDTAEVNRLNRLSMQYLHVDLDSVQYFSQQALALARRIDDRRGMAQAMVNSSIYNMSKGNTSVALQEGLEALKTYEALSAKDGIAGACLQIALVYKEIAGSKLTDEYLKKGIEYGRLAYNIFASEADTSSMANSLNAVGIIYRDRGKIITQSHYYDSAFDCYREAIALIEKSKDGINHLPKLYNNISQIYFEYKQDYSTALDYAFRAVELNQKNGRDNSLTFNFLNIADIYRRMNKEEQALQYAIKARDISYRLNSPTRLGNTYGMIYRCYRDLGRFDSALHYYILADRITDSFANVSKTRQIAEMQTQYETVKKESEIQRLNVINSSKNRQIAFLAGGLLLFGLLAGTMVWLYRRVNRQKELISRQSKQLELMMKELHHRVKNNLQIVSSLLSLQTYRLTDQVSIAALRESQQRVHAMSFIHQRLYKTDHLTTVNVKEYITDLTESLLASYGYHRDGFDLQISVDQELLDVDKALPIGLIVNEIVTNAFKYAYREVERPSLHIECTEQGGEINLVIQDNGAGLDEKTWKQAGGSFGKQLVHTLCRQLRARQTLDVRQGTRFHFVIPKNVQAA